MIGDAHEPTSRLDAHHRFEERYERLKESRRTAPLVALLERFLEVDGVSQGGLVAIELFTTVIPLMIIGFAYFSGFSENASVGNLFIRELGLHHPLDDRVREAFGTSSGLQSTWTFFGVASFLVWGIPMSITVASMFAQAWRREQFSLLEKLGRGSAWFVLYLVTSVLRQRIGFGGHHGTAIRILLLTAALIPTWAFWSFTPGLLVRDGGRGWRYLLLAGLAGVVIDGIILVVAAHIVFPMLLSGWTGFGPIGVAMTLMTWCGVIGVGWVVTACASAVLWERNAPVRTVIESQTAEPELPAPQS